MVNVGISYLHPHSLAASGVGTLGNESASRDSISIAKVEASAQFSQFSSVLVVLGIPLNSDSYGIFYVSTTQLP
jgi:hypothetical protein